MSTPRKTHRSFTICCCPLSLVLCGLLLGASTVQAEYLFTPVSPTDATTSTMLLGESFSIDIKLASTASDFNTSAIFTVEFSKVGLQLDTFDWSAPYVTGSADDWSDPAIGDLPVIISGDLYFENFASSGEFYTGTLLTLGMTVPAGFEPGKIAITAVPDTFDDGLSSISTTGGQFTLNVVPEPSVFVLLLGALGTTILVMAVPRRFARRAK